MKGRVSFGFGTTAAYRNSERRLIPSGSDTPAERRWGIVAGNLDRFGIDGHFLSIPKYAKYPDWSLEFIRMACSKQWMLRSMERDNAPPRGSVLRDPTMVAKLGWPPVAAEAIETEFPTPAHPVWEALEISLRSAMSEALLGQKTPKQALDELARDWQRNLRRAGVGKS